MSAAAVAWLGGAYTREALGPMSWATQDPSLSTFSGGVDPKLWQFCAKDRDNHVSGQSCKGRQLIGCRVWVLSGRVEGG
jgi:hypothetical protein